MAISKKGKRKLHFRGELYFWYVEKDDDTLSDYLCILSENCEIHLSYRVNQITDYLISPKITVLKSKTLETGYYSFFPPLADEFISRHNVCAILNWYHIQKTKTNIKPLKMTISNNPFDNIDFKNGIVKHINSDFSILGEDMLQVIFPHNFILDVGYYGSHNAFIIYIIKNEDWENPFLKTHKSWSNLKESIINAVDLIEQQEE